MPEHTFDLVVVGTGSGLDVANWAAEDGLRVAIVEKGAIGGTCLNRGCIPSKLLIHSADVMETIRRARLFGIHVGDVKVDFRAIVRRATESVDGDSRNIAEALSELDNPRLFRGEGRFVGPKRLAVGDDVLVAERFLLATGARPRIPDVPGLRDVPFLTSTEALRLEELPGSLAILGGGYIGAELAHFFGALGSEVTIVHRHPTLLPGEDVEVAEAFTRVYQHRFRVLVDHDANGVRRDGDGVALDARNVRTGEVTTVRAEKLLVATGITPNSDTLDLAKTGVTVDAKGYIVVDGYLETKTPGIYALGDTVGRYALKHNANHEATYAFHNLRNPGERVAVDYTAMPRAIFASPQVAAVGATELEAARLGRPFVVGRYKYRDTAMGHAIEDEHGFVKFIVEEESGKILGCHIMGADASTLLHEVVVAMTAGDGTIGNVQRAIHVHPALPEVVHRAANSLGE